MKNVILGANIETTYSVNTNLKNEKDGADFKAIYVGKPALVVDSKVVSYDEILSFDGEIRYNKEATPLYDYRKINISEEETVNIKKEIFRADLNELHVYTDKILSNEEIGKEKAEKSLKYHTRMFNRQMIESNEKMKLYCDVNNLSYEKTDCFQLFKLVYGHDCWDIDNGVMKEATLKVDLDTMKVYKVQK